MKYTFLTYNIVDGVKGAIVKNKVEVTVLAESDDEANTKVRQIISCSDYELKRIEE